MKLKFWRKNSDDYILPFEDASEYVLNGDNVWGNSITWSKEPGEGDGTRARIMGWTTPKPKQGDIVWAEMKGGWGSWIIQDVEHTSVSDMFFADVRGVLDYMPPDREKPDRKSGATQLIGGKGEFIW